MNDPGIRFGEAFRFASLTAVMLAAVVQLGCQPPPVVAPISPGRLDHTPVAGIAGVVFTSTPTPGPSPTPIVAATVLAEPPEPLTVATDFAVSVFADSVGAVWGLARAPNGDIFATIPEDNRVIVLPDRDRNGIADFVGTWYGGAGLNVPYGVVVHAGWVWVADTDGVVRFPYAEGQLEAGGAPEQVMPLPGFGRNPARAIAFDREGRMHIGVGANCNACIETDTRAAAVLRFQADGTDGVLFARGLRDPAHLAVQPETGAIWATDKARDDLGDNGPPDELNLLIPGGDHGWPACTSDRRADAEFGGSSDRCLETIPSSIAFEAHSGPAGLAFVEGDGFPEEWKGHLFVALSGSTNRTLPIGHRIVRVPFEGGVPTGEVIDFVSGWLRPDTRRWGRPVELLFATDGALLVSDSGGHRIYRVVHTPRRRGTPLPLAHSPSGPVRMVYCRVRSNCPKF